MEARQDDRPDADWVQGLIRNFQDKLTCGLYEAIYRLDERSLGSLMHAQAHTCVAAFLDLVDLPIPMTLDAFLDAIRTSGPSQIDITREGDVIHWRERHHGECVCPFVKRGAIRLDAKLCICGAHWVERLFAVVTGTAVRVETVETAATGAQDCYFRIAVQGPLTSTPP
jgi:hypothetical protein